jgi:hypothetical protein
MTDVWQGIAASVVFTVLGAVLLFGAVLLTDFLTPGSLREQIWTDRNKGAAIFLSSTMLGIGAIVFTAIATAPTGLGAGAASVAIFGGIGLLLMAGAFWLLDLVTPGQLGDAVVDSGPHPAVWVSAAMNVAVAAIVSASIV